MLRSLLLASLLVALAQSSTTKQHLSVSALISDPYGDANLQCWQFTSPFHTYPTVGTALQLANVTNMTYVVLPPHSKEGLHKPPHMMFFILLSGLAHVTLPSSNKELWITPNAGGLIVAADTEGVGHYTEYPSAVESVALQVPFKDGKLPSYRVLYEGACISGQRSPWSNEQPVLEKNGVDSLGQR